ncbi:MAG TPA: hypothetical protein VK589_14845, partial [Chryseolinea sp.]|nr:hypothetical protein [Chryseolinea sp.]
ALVQNPETLLYEGSAGFNLLDSMSTMDKPYGQNCCRVSSPTQLNYYDHIKTFFRPANLYNTSISLSGGDARYDFNITFARAHHQSNFDGDGYNERNSLVSNVGFEILKGLKLRSITQLIFNRNTVNIWQKQDFGLGLNSFTLFQTRPFADFEKKDTQGNYASYYGSIVGVNQFNPYYEYQYARTMDKKIDLIQNFAINYALPKYADFEILYGINYQDQTVEHNVGSQTLNQNSIASGKFTSWINFENTGEITTIEKTRIFENFRARSTFRFDLINDFNSSLPLQFLTDITFDYRSDNFHHYGSSALGIPLIPPPVATNGSLFKIFEDYNEEFVTYGYFVNQRIEYKELAGISGGFRTDYSSAFGRGSDPFTFPRADGFFRISGLNGWDGSRFANTILEWKIRAAYGEAGIQPGPFDRYVTLTPRTLGKSNALFIGNEQSNPDLTVEVSKEFEAGSDLIIDGLKGNWLRNINISVSWWKRNTENLIFSADAPPSLGIGTIIDNALSLESSGVQLSVTTTLLKGKSWDWNLTTNFSTQTTILKDVKNASGEIATGNRILREGEKLGEVYGSLMLANVDQKGPDGEYLIPLDTSQLNPETEKKYGPNEVQSAYEVASNGWVVHKGSKQPFITNGKYSLGDPNPDFLLSFISDIRFRKFLSFSFQLDWVQGAKLYNYTRQWMYRDGIHSDYEQPFTIDGQTGAWTAFYRGAYLPARWEKNYFYEDASFVRLRNVAVAIDLSTLMTRLKFNRLQLVISARNLLTWTRYSGLDPETNSYGAKNRYSGSSTLARGMDENTLGNFRTYQLTLNIGL